MENIEKCEANMSNQVVVSPIFYMGIKTKLIKKGLIDLFPKNIDTFVDLFCGSGVVSMNVQAKRYLLNDIDINLINLLKFFKQNDSKKIIKDIEYVSNYFQLEYGKTDKVSFDNRSKYYDLELAEIHKQNYLRLRNEYNKTKHPLLLYVLLIYCFCHQIRINAKGEFNMPCGNGIFTQENRKWIKDSSSWFNNNVIFSNIDYQGVDLTKLSANDFVYLDPPYFNTTATYNESGGWTLQNDYNLFSFCDKLTSRGIKWAMSNVFENKGVANKHLIDWVENSNYNVHHFDKFVYSACGKGNAKTDEVLIMNY